MPKLHHVPSENLSSGTAQTAGMARAAAISGELTGAQSIWMGRSVMAPGAVSAPHHHGHSETAIYVVSGTPEFAYRDESGTEVRLRTRAGDYVFVPPLVHHLESNAHSDQEAVVVLARTTQEAIVENVEAL